MKTQRAKRHPGKDGRTFWSGRWRLLAAVFLLLAATVLWRAVRVEGDASSITLSRDATGILGTYSVSGPIDTSNPFFQPLGTNGRACGACHVASDGWSVTPEHIRQRFASSRGTDPIFRPVDGSNCPDSRGVNDSPPARFAYSLLLSKGLIRISLPIPSNAEFRAKAVSDPYGCALASDASGSTRLSVYRRPLPTTNLRFLSTVMFDGRETLKPLNDPSTFESNLKFNLADQVINAALIHFQAASPPTQEQVRQIVDFELSTFTAQAIDHAAGDLTSHGANGGPFFLSSMPYYPGINDPAGASATGTAFSPNAFTLFSSWEGPGRKSLRALARGSVARGEKIFNSAPLMIQDVKGLNDVQGVATIVGTCSTCHDTPGVGNHSLPVPLDIGISDVSWRKTGPLATALDELNPPRLPLYALRCSQRLGAPIDATVLTSDPGLAMISGRCEDIGKFKGPTLRGLAGHAPYFQNGAADTLDQVVRFYNERFQMALTSNEMADLVNFLNSL